jgi:hypothetical protein
MSKSSVLLTFGAYTSVGIVACIMCIAKSYGANVPPNAFIAAMSVLVAFGVLCIVALAAHGIKAFIKSHNSAHTAVDSLPDREGETPQESSAPPSRLKAGAPEPVVSTADIPQPA